MTSAALELCGLWLVSRLHVVTQKEGVMHTTPHPNHTCTCTCTCTCRCCAASASHTHQQRRERRGGSVMDTCT
ncbi:hypothetical protein DFP73DRAFT_542523 [Morchella snyderi]|nr:hypothetical protein DFP73DRAFT_542523 [Morchella snyderi]